MFEGECTNVVMDSDGSIGRPGMALASHSPSPPKKKKKKKLQANGPAPKNFIFRSFPIELSRSILGDAHTCEGKIVEYICVSVEMFESQKGKMTHECE
jgi:hypothetical protein